MTWAAQVVHMLRKELLHARYAMLLFVAVIALGAAHAFGFGGTSSIYGIIMFLMVPFAMALVAFAVQADSPVRSDAFWPSRPLSPTAVLASKLLLAVVLIALAVAGQSIGLAAFNTSIIQDRAATLEGLLTLATWMALALVLAAITKSLPNFVIALIVLCIGTVLILNFTIPQLTHTSRAVQVPLAVASTAVVVILVVALYRRRDPRLARATGAMLLITAVVASVNTTSPAHAGKFDAPVDGVSVAIELADSATQAANRDLVVVLRGTSRDTTLRLSLLNAFVHVTTATGANFSVPFSPYQNLHHVSEVSTTTPSGTVVMEESPSPVPMHITSDGGTVTTSLRLAPEQDRLIQGGVTQLHLVGAVLVQEPTLMASMPLAPGAMARASGHRFRVSALADRLGRDGLTLEMQRLSAPGTPSFEGEVWAGMIGNNPLDVVIADQSGQRMYAMDRRASGTSSSWIVLPGQSVFADSSLYVVHASSPRERPPSLDSLGRAGASLRVFRWKKRATFPVDVWSKPR
ncbi:MAG: hypothetical protein ABIY52_04610 [Gemmatimonadaceae bacterium]